MSRFSKWSSGGGHSHGGHSHGGHSHGGHSHGGGAAHGHGVPVDAGFVPADRGSAEAPAQLARGAGRGKVLYLDCISGIAGDMTLAALFDLGVPVAVVEDAIAALGLDEAKLEVRSGYAGAIGCLHVDVVVTGAPGERSYAEIRALLQKALLPPGVRELSERIFARLAVAESTVHRTTLDEVHFHEVGAVDALVDIVGAAAGFDYLGARVVASGVPLGRGLVECRHGVIPLPAPATLLLLQGVPTTPSGLEVELVTPTGAAILATVAEQFSEWLAVTPERVGWGAGTRGLPDRPNALRAVLGSPIERTGQGEAVVELSANIDDMTGEVGAYAVDALLRAGALDAWILPIVMKKGRPGIVLSALALDSAVHKVTAAFFSETTTIGVRQMNVSRTTLAREVETVETRFGPVEIKVSGEQRQTMKPEMERCAEIARREGLSLRAVIEEVLIQARSRR